ncbi:MAG: peptidylprolyl isomerase [Deltaproteobacteria bacterium]|nr:peptidylprolyl isomerase [Deltaproteobacteria bacterium]
MARIFKIVLIFALFSADIAVAGDKEPEEIFIDGIAAVVNEEAITLYEVDTGAGAETSEISMAVGGGQVSQKKPEEIRKGVLEKLIDGNLLLEEAKKLGLEVSDKDVENHLGLIMKNNGWNEDDLEGAVKMLGYDGIVAYKKHASKELLKNQVVRIKVMSKIKVSDQQVDEAVLKEYKEGKYEETIKVSHILFRIPDRTTLEEIAALREKAEGVKGKLLAGEKSFEDLAKEYSDDSSASRGGDVGYFTKGSLEPNFENAAFALKTGEISGVVQSAFGFHIIMVTDRKWTEIKDMEEARAKVKYYLHQKLFMEGYKEYLKQLRAKNKVIIF